ncbi:hypothetical protein C0993_007609 [Termitomyces sp. T159_Od127]|nr:hypothetical protein C0993_007609 [Termitomyces sp. T159_Od127]
MEDRHPRSPSPTLSLSAFNYTEDETSPMEIDSDPFTGSTPRANQETEAQHGLSNGRTKSQHVQSHPQHVTPDPIREHSMTKREGQQRETHEHPPHVREHHPTPQRKLSFSYPSGEQGTEQDADLNSQEQRIGSPMREASITPQSSLGDEHPPLDENSPELWIETTSENVTTNGKGLKRTVTPNGGWPQIHLAAAPTFNIAPNTLLEWEEMEGPTLWAHLYRGCYEHTVAGKTRTIDVCKKIIKNLVYVEYDEDLAVVFSDQDLLADNDNKFPHPYHLLVSGLSQQQIDCLAELQIVLTPETTIIFLPNNASKPLYILTISGLTYQDTPRAKALVENLARRAFHADPEICALLEGKMEQETEETMLRILNNICASFILLKKRNEHTRAWNIYFTTDSGLNDNDFALLQQKMRQCKFNTVGFGKGHTLTGKQQPHCTGCKSVDHNSGNCPFSKIPGWFGYKPGGTQDMAGATDFADTINSEERPSRTQQNREANRHQNVRKDRTGFFMRRGRGCT